MDDNSLSPQQRRALEVMVCKAEDMIGGLELTQERLDEWGVTQEEATEIKDVFLRRYPRLRWVFEVDVSLQRFKYQLFKDGQFFEQERTALEMGVEIHAAIETLQKHGFEFVPAGFDRQKLIDSLTFEPFVFEEGPDDGQYVGNYNRPTKETQERVRPGAVVRLKNGDVYFVGDCNALLGVCDDCCDFRYEAIAEIAYLWGKEPR